MFEERLVIFLKLYKFRVIALATIAAVVIYCFAIETPADRYCLKEKYATLQKGQSLDYAKKIETVCHLFAKRWGVPKE